MARLTEYTEFTNRLHASARPDKKAIESLKYNSKLEVTKADALNYWRSVSRRPCREVAYDLALKCVSENWCVSEQILLATAIRNFGITDR